MIASTASSACPDGSEWLVDEAATGEELAAALLRAGAVELLRALTP